MQKKTKIVCTLGPASQDYQTIKSLVKAGMNVARLNFSHGDHAEKKAKIDIVRKVAEELDTPIAILADMSGPKIRLGELDGRKEISKGQEIVLTLNPQAEVENELPIQYDLSPFVQTNQRIFLNDGLVELKVDEIKGKNIYTHATNSGWVSSHKGVNIPDTRLKGQVFTQKDSEDAEFALKEGVEYLALSFIQEVEDLEEARRMIQKLHPQTKIVVKVEKNEAVANLEDIIKATDAVMVARGDLAVEASAAEVPIVQQKIIHLSRQYRKPVIVATQMLESMIENPRPTRAEVSDVAYAVLDQVDAVMLSAESASGKYPVEAVTIMAEVILTVENHPETSHYIRTNWENIEKKEMEFNAIASSAASLAYRIGAEIVAVASATGAGVRRMASFRPSSYIVAITHDQFTANQLALVWGTHSLVVKPTKDTDTFWNAIVETLKKNEQVKKNDKIVMVGGTTVGIAGATYTIKVVSI
jgi:pyruvate kinase